MLTPKELATQVHENYRRTLISGGNPNFISMVEQAINQFKKEQLKPPTCKAHPKYQGLRKPQGNCEDCWRLYIFNKDQK